MGVWKAAVDRSGCADDNADDWASDVAMKDGYNGYLPAAVIVRRQSFGGGRSAAIVRRWWASSNGYLPATAVIQRWLRVWQ